MPEFIRDFLYEQLAAIYWGFASFVIVLFAFQTLSYDKSTILMGGGLLVQIVLWIMRCRRRRQDGQQDRFEVHGKKEVCIVTAPPLVLFLFAIYLVRISDNAVLPWICGAATSVVAASLFFYRVARNELRTG